MITTAIIIAALALLVIQHLQHRRDLAEAEARRQHALGAWREEVATLQQQHRDATVALKESYRKTRLLQ